MNKSLAARVLALLFAAANAIAATTTTVVDIPVGNGVTQRILYVRPDAPIATLVAIPGGQGIYAFGDDGSSGTDASLCNPHYRNRQAFADRGFAMAFVDQDSAGVVFNPVDITAVMRYLRSRDNIPVWVTGGSASTPITLFMGANFPADIPGGIAVISPGPFAASVANAVRRPALVISHAQDDAAIPYAGPLYNALSSATPRGQATLFGGSSAGCGYHAYQNLDAEFVEATSAFVKANNPVSSAPVAHFNVHGMWWRGISESGWGINLVHQGSTVFGTWFTYDADGSDLWLVMDNLQLVADDTWSGAVYRTTGSPFDAASYDNARFTPTAVGTATLTFTDANNGSITWTVNGATITKPITKFSYQEAMPTCAHGASQGGNVNYQDLWWRSPAASENGVGYNIVHQGDILFVTWFTYDVDGTALWLFMDNAAKTGTGTYSGEIKQARGSPINVVPYDAAKFAPTTVGTGTFTFTDANTGTFSYTVKGVTQSKPITRFVFANPVTTCVFAN
jgi:hypothetical protein